MNENTTRTILLVEDNEDDVFLMKRALRVASVTNPVQIARDGEEARNYLGGNGDFADRHKFPFPSYIFLDLKLPYVSGLELLKWRTEQPDLTSSVVIVLTSSSEPRDVKMAYRLGASAYVVKPPMAEQLVEIVKAFRLFWLGYNLFPEAQA